MNPFPKKSRKLVVFGRKMEPLLVGAVLEVLKVRIPESWFILLRRIFWMNFIDFSSKFLIPPVTGLGFSKGSLLDALVSKP